MRQLKYLVPNAFTCGSMLLGLASVARAAAGDFQLAAWMIVWGALLDKLDGSSARLLGASSRIGGELDSFADFSVFGIAPAALVFFQLRAPSASTLTMVLVTIACGSYVVATATRLARFNVTVPPGGDCLFYGVPSTMAGAMVASGLLTWDKYLADRTLPPVAAIGLVVLGALEVSTFRLPKLKHRKKLLLNLTQYTIVVLGYILAPARLLPEYFFGLAAAYSFGGMLWCALQPAPADDPQAPPRPAAT